MRVSVLFLSLRLLLATKEIKDGDSLFIDSSVDPDLYFLHRVLPDSPVAALHLTVTLYSASQPLSICVTLVLGNPGCKYQGSALQPYVVVSDEDMRITGSIYAIVMCGKLCRFRITAMRANPISLKLNKAVFAVMDEGGKANFRYKARERAEVRVAAKGRGGAVSLSVKSEKRVESLCYRQWDDSQICELGVDSGVWVDIGTVGGAFDLVKLVRDSQGVAEEGAAEELQSGVQAAAALLLGEVKEYSYKVLLKKSMLEVALSQYSGDSDIAISATPGCKSSALVSNREGNDVISLTPSERLALFNQTNGWLYICILSESDSAFALSAKEDISAGKWLMFNTQERGEVRLNRWDYYQIPVGRTERMNVTVEVRVVTGNPDLYVGLCRQLQCYFREPIVHYPGDCKSQSDNVSYSANSDDFESVTVTHSPELCSSDCHYTVGVLGRSREPSLYMLTAQTSSVTPHIALSTKTTYIAKNPRSSTTFFKHIVTSPSTTLLEFLLSPQLGDPDLYVSSSNPFPTSLTAEYSSPRLGHLDELVSIQAGTEGLKDEYYLAVVAASPASFSLSVFESQSNFIDHIELLPGVETTQYFRHSQIISASFSVSMSPKARKPVRLSVLPADGSVEVCVSPLHIGDVCVWAFACDSQSVFDCVYEIPASDPALQPHSRYSMNVTLSARDDMLNLVTLWYTAGQHVKLRLSDSHRDVVDLGATLYFSMTVYRPWVTLVVFEQIFSGNVDIYVSVGEHSKYPDCETADLVGDSEFEDRIVVSTALMQKKCSSDACVVYIAAKAVVRSAFAVQIKHESESFLSLQSGITYFLQISNGERFKTSLSLGSVESAMISVHVLEGTVKIDSKMTTKHQYCFDPTCDWIEVSTIATAPDILGSSVSTEVIKAHCSPFSCTLWMIVTCDSPYCWLQIVGIQSHHPILTPNSPIFDSVSKDRVQYYLLYNASNIVEMTVTLTVLSGRSDADLYVTKGTKEVSLPNFRWKSTRKGDDFVTIGPTDLEIDEKNCGYYLIAIHGVDACSYSLVVTTQESVAMPLSVTGYKTRIGGNASIYCYFPHKYNEMVQIVLAPRYGNLEMYVSSYYTFPARDEYPSESKHHWKTSNTTGRRREINIVPGDDHFCYNCTYIALIRNQAKVGAEYYISRNLRSRGLIHLVPGFTETVQVGLEAVARFELTYWDRGTELYLETIRGKVTPQVLFGEDQLWREWRCLLGICVMELGMGEKNRSLALVMSVTAQEGNSVVRLKAEGRTVRKYVSLGASEVVAVRRGEGGGREFVVENGMHWDITAIGGHGNYTVEEYVSVGELTKLAGTHTLESRDADRFLKRIAGRTEHDGFEHSLKLQIDGNDTENGREFELFRISVANESRQIAFNSEQFGQLSVENPEIEYRIEGLNADVIAEIALQWCDFSPKVSVETEQLDGSSRFEEVFQQGETSLISLFSLQNVTRILIKVKAEGLIDDTNRTDFMLSARVVNQDIALLPGNKGRISIDYQQGNSAEITWKPLISPQRVPVTATYHVYVAASSLHPLSLCMLHRHVESGHAVLISAGLDINATVRTDQWVTVLACEMGLRTVGLCSYVLYQERHLETSQTSWYPLAFGLGLLSLCVAVFLLKIYSCYRKRRTSEQHRLLLPQSSELSILVPN